MRRSRTGGLWAGLVLSALVLLLLLVFILQNGGPVLDEAVNCYAHNAARSTPAPTATALETRSRTPPI